MYNHLFKSLTIKYMRSLNLIFQSPWYRSWTSGTGTLTPCCSYQINNWSGMSLFLCWWRRKRWFWVRIDIYLSVFFFHQGNSGVLYINEIPVYCTYTVYMRWAFKSVNVVSFLPCLFNLFAPLYSIMCIDFNDIRYL